MKSRRRGVSQDPRPAGDDEVSIDELDADSERLEGAAGLGVVPNDFWAADLFLKDAEVWFFLSFAFDPRGAPPVLTTDEPCLWNGHKIREADFCRASTPRLRASRGSARAWEHPRLYHRDDPFTPGRVSYLGNQFRSRSCFFYLDSGSVSFRFFSFLFMSIRHRGGGLGSAIRFRQGLCLSRC